MTNDDVRKEMNDWMRKTFKVAGGDCLKDRNGDEYTVTGWGYSIEEKWIWINCKSRRTGIIYQIDLERIRNGEYSPCQA